MPEAAAVEIGAGERLGEVVGEVAVVAEEVLAEGIGDDFIHVDGDDLTGGRLRKRHAAGWSPVANPS